MSDNDSFKAMRKLAMTLGASCPESDEDIFKASFINLLNRSAKKVVSALSSDTIPKEKQEYLNNNSIFVVNSEAYYFEVKCKIDISILKNCMIFKTQSEMYDNVSVRLNEELTDLKDGNIVIKEVVDGYDYLLKNEWNECEINDGDTIELWISKFAL
jgi:hypothetical protein